MGYKDGSPFFMDNLAKGRVPPRLIEEIKRKKVSVEEMVLWEESKPAIRVSTTGKNVFIEANLCFSIHKLLGVLGGLASVLWFSVKLAPIVYDLLLEL